MPIIAVIGPDLQEKTLRDVITMMMLMMMRIMMPLIMIMNFDCKITLASEIEKNSLILLDERCFFCILAFYEPTSFGLPSFVVCPKSDAQYDDDGCDTNLQHKQQRFLWSWFLPPRAASGKALRSSSALTVMWCFTS